MVKTINEINIDLQATLTQRDSAIAELQSLVKQLQDELATKEVSVEDTDVYKALVDANDLLQIELDYVKGQLETANKSVEEFNKKVEETASNKALDIVAEVGTTPVVDRVETPETKKWDGYTIRPL